MVALPSHERVILVGHSLGGLAISYAMERFPEKISAAVFVTTLMPGPTLNISNLNQESFRRREFILDSRYTYDDGPSNPPTTFILGPLYSATNVFQFSPIEDLALAMLLLRLLRLYSDEDMSKVLMLSGKRYGSVDWVFVICDEDKLVKKDFLRWMVEKNLPNEVVEITGSDHMAMMSKPVELSVHLRCIADKYY
ncbi:unnamed protein product [Ilex paraguariensis]|uniref:AB hydrolase-1 domain-containing protein n=1 Tax=Ilex paraguariensis TaxID=185542 RepID=A0ABC8SNS6_9AQUA